MKRKILVTGPNNIVMDFLQHTNTYFTGLSTTPYINDVMRHFKLFEPETFLIFADENNSELISIAGAVKRHYSYNEAPIIIVSNKDLYDTVYQKNFGNASLFIQRPISPDNLSLRIENFLDDREAKLSKNTAEDTSKVDDANAQENNEVFENTLEQTAKKHILVVDDDRSILKMLKASLEDQYDVTTVVNGVITEKVIEAKKVDLIILDYEMPIKTGAEVFKSLKSHPIGKNIPVCFLTGVAERSKIEEIMALRPHGYLLKPINMDMFLSTVHNLLY